MSSIRPIIADSIVTGTLTLLALLVCIGTGWIITAPQTEHDISLSDAEERALVQGKHIIDFTVVENDTEPRVQFTYIGTRVPERLAVNEVIGARTERSYTIDLHTIQNGIKTLQTITYTNPQFIKQPDGWYYIEYANVREKNFNVMMKKSLLRTMVLTAYAASVSPYSESGDGYINNYGDCFGENTWSNLRSASAGIDAIYTQHIAPFSQITTVNCGSEKTPIIASLYLLSRGFIPFDTSAIPYGAHITAATLNLYSWSSGGIYDDDNDSYAYLTVVQTSQASHTQLVPEDYDAIGTTEGVDVGNRKDISSLSNGTYVSFTLNQTGQSWIATRGQQSACSSSTGISCFGIREGHDLEDVAPDVETYTGVNFYASEQSGTSQDPYLSVTYTLPFAFWQFQDF